MTLSRPLDDSGEGIQPSGKRWGLSDAIGLSAFLVALTFIAVRLPLSLDLSDEAYFAIFLDDWLKGSIRTSTLSTLHETAALVVYPFALLFHKINGSSDGLFLFLRWIYLFLSASMAIVWLNFMRTMRFRKMSWVVAIIAIGYIPFGLPAPSYNMLALHGLAISLAAFGIANAQDTKGQGVKQRVWLLTSAVSAAIATVAYPPLLAWLGFSFLLTFATPGIGVRERVTDFLALSLIVAIAWACVLAALTFNGLVDSLYNVSVLNSVGNLQRKIVLSLQILWWHKWYTATLLAAFGLGLLRPRVPYWVAASVVLGTTAGCFLLSPTLFLRAHDVLTIWIATGVWLLRGFAPRAYGDARLVAIIYASSLVAGIVIALSATYSPYNFCIGAFPAAMLAIAYGFGGERTRNVLVSGALAACIVGISYGDHFGNENSRDQEKVVSGFFSGMWGSTEAVALINYTRDEVASATEPDKTLLVLGRYPGLSLATPARPLAISVWPIFLEVSPKSQDLMERFYSDPSHRPKAVVIYRDAILTPINTMGSFFREWYQEVDHRKIGQGEASLFLRK